MNTMNQSRDGDWEQNAMETDVMPLEGKPVVDSGLGAQVPQAVTPQVAGEVRALTPPTSSFDQMLKDCGLIEKPVYQMLVQPVGFSGSPVAIEVTRKYAVGTRITRADGRLYRICRIRRTRKTRVESLSPFQIWRSL